MGREVGSLLALRESDEVPALKVRELDRAAAVLLVEGPPQFQAVKLFAHDQRASSVELSIGQMSAGERP